MTLLVAAAVLASVSPGSYRGCLLPPQEPPAEEPCPGGIPVLCYHGLTEDKGISVSPYRFRHDLEVLHERGFYLVTTEDLEGGLTRVPSDRIPLLLTFDDGWQSQFNMITGPDGSISIDPLCAVGILEDFCAGNPDFGRGAVFFISYDKIPFGQAELVGEKFNFLLDNGYCLGNHSRRHQSLMSLPPELWSASFAGVVDRMREHLGLRTPLVDTAAWPGGRIPEGSWADERLSTVLYDNHPILGMGFSVDGALARLGTIDGLSGRLRISRIDMGLYSTDRLLSHGGFYRPVTSRESLHSPMPPRFAPLEPICTTD